MYVVVMCNQPNSNVTKISQLIYMCNQNDIYMTKINHLSNTCTNVTKVNHFDYTCIINIGWSHFKKKKIKHVDPLHFTLFVHSQWFKKNWMCYFILHKISLKCENKQKSKNSLK
jgi:hypothetical protein